MHRKTVAAEGRRDRSMRDKRERIFGAAAQLFGERGFSDVSTQEVSDLADVAAGTLFRYASSKGELLLMVFNEELRAALRSGQDDAAREPSPAAAIIAMVTPILERAALSPQNSAVYQRELLFGPDGDPYRAEGLQLVSGLEDQIAARLVADATTLGFQPDNDRALLVGSLVFAATHLAISRSSTGVHAERAALQDLRAQIALTVDGFFAALPPSGEADKA